MLSKLTLVRSIIILGCFGGFILINNNIRNGPPEYTKTIKYTEPIQETHEYVNFSSPIERQTHPSTVRDIIQKQKEMIDKNLKNFPFPNGKSLKDHQLSSGGKPKRSIIITTWRSGSTFLGDVLNSLRGNFYHYEPLLDFGIVRIRGPPLAKPAIANLKNLLNCDYSNMERYINYGKSHLHLFTHNIRLWGRCNQLQHYCWDPRFLSDYCKLFPFQSMKVVRLSLKLARELLEDKSLGVKIVLLVRDPRGTLQSRKHRDWCPGIDDCDKPKVLCDDLISDYEAAAVLQKEYPDDFRAIRYEDLSSDPYTHVKELFDFFGLYLHDDVSQFLDTHTKVNVGGVSSTFRDSKSAPFHWRYDLNFTEVRDIQNSCERAMRLWGYRVAVNETHLKEFDPIYDYVIE